MTMPQQFGQLAAQGAQQWQPAPGMYPSQQPAASAPVAPPNPDDLMQPFEKLPALPVGGPYNGQPAKSPQGQFVGGRVLAKSAFPEMQEVDVFNPATGQVERQRIQRRTKNGSPIWGVRYELDINGARYNFWADGSFKDDEYTSRKGAVQKAMVAAGARTIDIGGELYVAWTRQVPRPKGSPANDWAARYVPPSTAMADAAMAPQMSTPAGMPQQAPAPSMAAQINVPAPAPAQGQPPF